VLENTPRGQKFLDQLPDYVNGLLSKDDQAWMEQFIRDNPHAEDELRFERRLIEVINSAVSPIPIEQALAKSIARAEKEGLLKPSSQRSQSGSAPPTARQPPVDSNKSWWRSLWQPLPVPAPILATLVAAVVVPALWVAQRANVQAPDESSPVYRGATQIPAVPCAQQYRLRIVFAKQAQVEEVSLLLGKLGADVTAGPSVNGEFWVRLSTPAALQKAIETLKAQTWVDDVWIPPADSTLGCR
jgi:anti-sigma factor RsiW